MGRAPCCDKANVKKGPWSPEEDAKLKSYIEQHGTGGNWIALPQKIGLKRCGKSCRLRWLNYLRPNIKHGGFSEEEDNIICSLYISIGSRWSIIAAQLPGRTDNDIKNYWNTRLKKKLLGKQRKEQQARKGSGVKQLDMKRGGNHGNIIPQMDSSSALTNNIYNSIIESPFWPELPVLSPTPYCNQEPRLNDHASIRKLLIKLGGRFSDEDDQLIHNIASNNPHLVPVDASYGTPHDRQIYDHHHISSSASSIEALNDSAQFAPNVYGEAGQSSSAPGLEEMTYSDQQRLDGLEFLLSDNMGSVSTIGTSCGESLIGWFGEISSLACPPECAFDELKYPGSL